MLRPFPHTIALVGLLLLTPTMTGRAVSGVVSGPLVVCDAWPECTDLTTWMRDVMRLEGLEQSSETAQGKAFFRWLRLFSKMAVGGMIQAHEGPYGDESHVSDMHKNLFVYGWGFCDTHSRIAEAAWSEMKGAAGKAERVITQHENGGYHTMYRLNLDGHWGAFDARYGYYLVDRDAHDARVLGWAEVGVDANILKNKGFRWRSQPFFEHFGREWDRAFLIQPAYYESEAAWRSAGAPVECVFGDSRYRLGTPLHDMAFQMPKGTTIERHWDNTARKFYRPGKDYERPFLPSGRFYRVTESMFDGNWPRHDPNFKHCEPYLTTVPVDEGYPPEVAGGRTIGQAWGRILYEPDWTDPRLLEGANVTTDLERHTKAPFLRTSEGGEGGEAVFDFYCPYILVDATVSGKWTAEEDDRATVEIRTLAPKPGTTNQPDVWSEWQTVHAGTSPFQIGLGRERFNGKDVTVHGVYRFQLRFRIDENRRRPAPAGLADMRLVAHFENGIMSIPRLQAGKNVVHFKVRDASKIGGPIDVTYDYQTRSGPTSHRQTLTRHDFSENMATYTLDAGDLVRCNRLSIRY